MQQIQPYLNPDGRLRNTERVPGSPIALRPTRAIALALVQQDLSLFGATLEPQGSRLVKVSVTVKYLLPTNSPVYAGP